MNFGCFVKEKRQQKGISLRGLADLLGIAPSYMSDIEKGHRNAPTKEILDKMISILELSKNEEIEFLDLAAMSKSTVANDIVDYLSDNPNIRVALRKAKDLNFGDEEWIKIIEEMTKKK
ncbi:MAG: helix-turn-helix transcriptional regulator [bacterium]|nr:helix-turn-helix transcriptional regulator [bacterium]